jgi:N-acetylglucosaminyldiphosphoundecaprenol N-acetyl-beta-D-mannosaminyltransferase
MGELREEHTARGRVLELTVDGVTMAAALARILNWADQLEARMVCAADVHMVMRHHDDVAFRQVMTQADLVTPDGMPLVWLLRRHGFPQQERVCGPDLTLALCRAAESRGLRVGFYGGKPDVLAALCARLRAEFPRLRIEYSFSPPFRSLDAQEDQVQVEAIRQAGIRLLFVGLGCPKQERWMAAHKSRLDMVLLGVGAAFDFHAEAIKRAPSWVQKVGLEWLYRIGAEPRRLAKRALQHYPRFVWHVLFHPFRGR